jgi:SAM-dependent methyltransferase
MIRLMHRPDAKDTMYEGGGNGFVPPLTTLPEVTRWGLPTRLLRRAGDIREYEPASIIASLIGDPVTVLNVGPTWGRDFYGLSTQGHNVFNLDIAPQTGLPHTVIGDVTRPLPFPASCFDAVVIAEVLEHLIEDHRALVEIRRVLAADGKLVVTVPFYQDVPLYHVRIHSRRSIIRLLAATGFAAEALIYRSGFISHPKIVHGTRKLLRPLGLARSWYRLVAKIDYWWGTGPFAERSARGCYILARKTAAALDWRHLNRSTYENR